MHELANVQLDSKNGAIMFKKLCCRHLGWAHVHIKKDGEGVQCDENKAGDKNGQGGGV